MNMPSLSELPSNISRKKLTKALGRLGFVISTKGGKGAHIKVTFTKTQKSITIPSNNLSKNILKYILKEIEDCSGVVWDEIKKKI